MLFLASPKVDNGEHNNGCSMKKDDFAVAHNEDDIVHHCLHLV